MSAPTQNPTRHPTPAGPRILAETAVLTRRSLAHWRAQPGPVLLGWLFPVLVVGMFVALFGGAFATPPGVDYIDLLLPGALVMTALFGLESTALAVSTDAAGGVRDRFRSLPISSASVLGGRCLADLAASVVGLLVVAGAGLALGWSPAAGPGALLGAFGLLLALRFSLLWLGIRLGLTAAGTAAVTTVQVLVWPVLFASGVFVDPATMPRWLGAVAAWNPLSATATALRELFGGPGWPALGWADTHALLLAVLWPLLLTAVFAPLAVRRHRRFGD